MDISSSKVTPKSGFSVRIVVCDYYLGKPAPGIDVIYSEFRGSDIKQVPVLRIFGSAQDGHKACLHVHGVFPYFYIPCPNPYPQPQFLYQIAASLDKALNIAMKQATSASQHVYKITLVKGLPFYGYHDKEHLYLKVFLYNPGLIKQAVELCSNGAILGQNFQPHESHLNFTLQFFIDFNLFGMSNIDLQTVFFRKKTDLSQNSNDSILSNDNPLKRESICFYEADCIASHIINRQRVGRGDGIENPGLEEVWNQERERRKQLNMSLASKSLSQARIGLTETESHYKYEQLLLVKLSGLADEPVVVTNDIDQYPAVSLEGSQLYSAVDVSVHLPNSTSLSGFDVTLQQDVDLTLTQDLDGTLVDEELALNCSLAVHHSQVLLDNEDLELLDVLKDMAEDRRVDDDSILATPAEDNRDDDELDDNLEYSQIYNEDTLLLENEESIQVEETIQESWNDSFWDDITIPQLDGTFDDDHVKKVRKRKMRPFKLGLSRPKAKKKQADAVETNINTAESVKTITDSAETVETVTNNAESADTIISNDESVEISHSNTQTNINTNSNVPLDNDINDIDIEEIENSFNEVDNSKNVQINKTAKKVTKRAVRNKKVSKLGTTIVETPSVTAIVEDNINTLNIINNSTNKDIDKLNLNKTIKEEPYTVIKSEKTEDLNQTSNNKSVTELVNKATAKLEASESYDLVNNFEPKPGSSKCDIKLENIVKSDINNDKDYINDSFESSPEDNKLGFISFYNVSRIFDLPTSDKSNGSESDEGIKEFNIEHENYEEISENVSIKLDMSISDNAEIDDKIKELDVKMENKVVVDEKLSESSEDIKLRYSDSTQELDEIKTLTKSQHITDNKDIVILTPKFRSPTYSYIKQTLDKYNLKQNKCQEPFYSNYKDAGGKIEIGQRVLKVNSKSVQHQKPFDRVLNTTTIEEWRQLLFLQTNEMTEESSKIENLKTILAGNRQVVLEPVFKPPPASDILKWLQDNKKVEVKEDAIKEVIDKEADKDDMDNSQAIGLNEDVINSSISLEASDKDKSCANESLQVTMHPDGSFLCFGTEESQKEIADSPIVEVNNLTLMVLEIHASVRGDLNPDPSLDEIQAAFITITNDSPSNTSHKHTTEIIVADDLPNPKYLERCLIDSKKYNITYVANESDIIEKVIELVKLHDPDILCGYEIEMASWGYFLERAEVLGLEIVLEVSRIIEKYRQKRWKRDDNDFEGRIIGRIMLNVWRLFRHELALSSYSFENCMHEILKERVPQYSFTKLAEWWGDESRILRWISVEYYLTRLSGTIRMLEKLDIINRTAELARLFGLQWWEVLSRGSQFRVESLMLRAARPLNLVALSPTVTQRANMTAPECLPLIFEPESRFYTDPVIVLDFQSLYPSMMIAYNYCFSTCIGRVQNITGDAPYEFGAWRLRIPKAKLDTLLAQGLVHFSPVGVGFVSAGVRRGVLPALLRRILAARQAVKKSMSMQSDSAVKKAMHSRQLGLKLIANVTYGYTAANFSGRMPCVEVGDSVVAKGRETLERAIRLVENRHDQWNAKVIYGDTDSMFVLVAGRTRQEAFVIGQEIADAVTNDNPSPVALKLEKVYQPCILQTKKRYVGFMYESADQVDPVYEAKGIETVRRDGCPAGVKLLKSSLIELFTTRDISRVKLLVTKSLLALCSGGVSPRELFFSREYRGSLLSRGPAAPQQFIAQRLVARDKRLEPRKGWRMAWLVTAGAPGLPLVKLSYSPKEILRTPRPPHISYYACRVLLPPLHRCFSLLGVDVFQWWLELGFSRDISQSHHSLALGGIARYLWRERCFLCEQRSTTSICNKCTGSPQASVATVMSRLSVATQHVHYCEQICSSCAGSTKYSDCENVECPVLWRRQSALNKLTQVHDLVRQMPATLKCSQSIDF